MPYKDLQKQREYQRQWAALHRAEYFNNRSCKRCGSVSELELDHINPSTKVSHNIWSWSEERRNTELQKCQVLCNSCHKLKTVENGDVKKGEKVHFSKLKEKDVREIKTLLDQGLSQTEISSMYGVHKTTIQKIDKKIIWKHIIQ